MNRVGEVDPLVTRLIEVVDRLASSPDQQKAYLHKLRVGDSADELALEFDDMFRPGWVRNAVVSCSRPDTPVRSTTANRPGR
jgi:hypothetical protein